jgi:hypothetical protein
MVTATKGLYRFEVDKAILNKRDWVKYRVYPDWHARVIDSNIIKGMPGKDFDELIEKHVNAYLFEKVEPPAQIASAIMNIADDYMNGREPIIKSGDYLQLQNYLRGGSGR